DELDQGMNKLNEEGIKKVTDIFNGDAEDLLKQVESMIDNAKDYQTFTGISDHMTGKVKFIFVAE
ncbi:MAG: hypothetical protein MJ117_07800, partial [Lachnospiraceae bacterium]|nr:hypothetical protein [Lachnospiraceae bacterium]